MLHAKTAVVDGVWSTVGSSNLDWRSFLHNEEVIAIVLTTTQWKPNRILDPDDVVVQSILSSLKEAGWKIEPS